MKFIALFLIVSAAVCSLVNAREEKNRCNLGRLNSSVQTLLSIIPGPAGNQQVYLWDTLNLVARFLLLNQSQVTALSYNVSQQAQANITNLNWAALPVDVQSLLASQSAPVIYSLTFAQWAWVDSSNAFANSTLFSLLSASAQSCASNASTLIAPLTFGLQIDITVLNQTLSAANSYRRHRNLVKEFFESFYESLSQFVSQGERYKRHFEFSYKRQPTALSTFNDAVKRAGSFLRLLGIGGNRH